MKGFSSAHLGRVRENMRLLKELVDKTSHKKDDTTFVSVRFQYRKKVENFLSGKGVIDRRT